MKKKFCFVALVLFLTILIGCKCKQEPHEFNYAIGDLVAPILDPSKKGVVVDRIRYCSGDKDRYGVKFDINGTTIWLEEFEIKSYVKEEENNETEG